VHERLLSERKRHASVCYVTDGYRTLVGAGHNVVSAKG
jgi:hypothetical protein